MVSSAIMKVLLLLLPICISCRGASQVPVSQEPLHHNVFENAWVRVLDVRIQPGDTTQFHKHETPSVFIVLNPVKTGSQVIQEENSSTALRGDSAISFESFATTPRIHRVWNEDSTEFHVMDIELLSKGQAAMRSPFSNVPNCQLLIDAAPARVYKLNMEEGKNLQLNNKRPLLIVGLTDIIGNVSVNNKSFSRKGDLIFIEPGKSIQILNQSGQPYSFAVLELK
jgi:redox-sensitive bicupin YhaK (pirin superfamily)